ncbi:MAG TPA: hypothetical protein VNA28_16940 [Solirubrobacteraceae bacterium]|nr:hypothetical protein [Solirubrobacteraceae bacterium]
MSTRRFTSATALAALVATAMLAGAAGPASGAAKVTCSTKGTTIAAGTGARVFIVKSGATRRVYGCSTSARKLRTLGRAEGEGVVAKTLTVNGPRVAYALRACGETGCQQSVLVRDLKTGKSVSAALSAPGDVEQEVSDILLSRTGTVAWIAEERSEAGAATARYVSSRKPGAFTGIPVVPHATGLDIAAGSLALAGNTLYWTQGAVPRAAAIG